MTFSQRCNIWDKLIALFFLLLTLPISLITYILIKLSNPKLPAICKLKRYGLNKKPFYLYKFRSMTNSNRIREESNPMGRNKNDPRITKIGKVIRKFSIDEIPNLINILKGDLKIIGVRPCEEEEIKYLPPERFNYLPGLSGITSREGNKNPTLKEQYDAELSFSLNYGKVEKRKALKNAFKVIWNNK